MSITSSMLRLVKFEHTIFALPFAFVGVIAGLRSFPDSKTSLLILGAMIGARTAAMGLNRIIDLPYDKKNPRTKKWELVTGEIKEKPVWILIFFSLIILGYCTKELSHLAWQLSPIAILLLSIYPFTKRWGIFCHLWLGLTLSCAPAGGFIAVTNGWGDNLYMICLAVTFWVAGFDILYSMQDTSFDKKEGLYSIPSVYGKEKAFLISRIFHFFAAIFFFLFGKAFDWSQSWTIGCCLMTILLVWQHSIISPKNLKKINASFFSANGWISVLLLIAASLTI